MASEVRVTEVRKTIDAIVRKCQSAQGSQCAAPHETTQSTLSSLRERVGHSNTRSSMSSHTWSRELSHVNDMEEESQAGEDAISEVSKAWSTFGDSSDEGQILTSSSSQEGQSADEDDGLSECVFTKAIAVLQLAEAAMLTHARLPSERVHVIQASTSQVLRGVTARLQEAMESHAEEDAGCAEPCPEPSCTEFQRVAQLLRAMKMAYDEELATAKVLAAISVLEERFVPVGAPCEMEEMEEQQVHNMLREAAAKSLVELARLASGLLAKVLHRFARISSFDVTSKLLRSKALSCATLAGVTVKVASSLSKNRLGHRSALGHDEVSRALEELQKLSADLLPKLGVWAVPKDRTVLSAAEQIEEGLELYARGKTEDAVDPLERVLGSSSGLARLDRTASSALHCVVSLSAEVLQRASGHVVAFEVDFD